jgi:streptomycin 6-kinase
METRFTHDEKGLLEQAFQLRESQTEEHRAIMRAEFEMNWPALVAYVKQSEARGEKMRGDVLFALGEGQGAVRLLKRSYGTCSTVPS